jgi:hypothetical protein
MVKSSRSRRFTILTASRLSDRIKVTAANAGWERDNTANREIAVDLCCREPAAAPSPIAIITAGGTALA